MPRLPISARSTLANNPVRDSIRRLAAAGAIRKAGLEYSVHSDPAFFFCLCPVIQTAGRQSHAYVLPLMAQIKFLIISEKRVPQNHSSVWIVRSHASGIEYHVCRRFGTARFLEGRYSCPPQIHPAAGIALNSPNEDE